MALGTPANSSILKGPQLLCLSCACVLAECTIGSQKREEIRRFRADLKYLEGLSSTTSFLPPSREFKLLLLLLLLLPRSLFLLLLLLLTLSIIDEE